MDARERLIGKIVSGVVAHKQAKAEVALERFLANRQVARRAAKNSVVKPLLRRALETGALKPDARPSEARDYVDKCFTAGFVSASLERLLPPNRGGFPKPALLIYEALREKFASHSEHARLGTSKPFSKYLKAIARQLHLQGTSENTIRGSSAIADAVLDHAVAEYDLLRELAPHSLIPAIASRRNVFQAYDVYREAERVFGRAGFARTVASKVLRGQYASVEQALSQ